ncbi:hypothetical protein ACFE04_016257 [Oxalis oulophora]
MEKLILTSTAPFSQNRGVKRMWSGKFLSGICVRENEPEPDTVAVVAAAYYLVERYKASSLGAPNTRKLKDNEANAKVPERVGSQNYFFAVSLSGFAPHTAEATKKEAEKRESVRRPLPSRLQHPICPFTLPQSSANRSTYGERRVSGAVQNRIEPQLALPQQPQPFV